MSNGSMATALRPATQRRRRQIMDAALDCFVSSGYVETTLADIRARSKSSIGSIYHLFKSKEEIAGAVYLEGMKSHQDALLERVRTAESAEEIVRRIVYGYVDWLEHNDKLARFLMTMRQAELLPEVKAEVKKYNRIFFGELRTRLGEHVDKGKVKALPWDVMTWIVIAPVHEYARAWLAGRHRVAPSEAAKLFADAAWDGLRAATKAAQSRKSGHERD